MYLSVTTITVVLNVTQAPNIDITAAKNFSSIIVHFSTVLRVKRDQQAHALTAAPVSTRIIPARIPARPALRPRTLQLQVPHRPAVSVTLGTQGQTVKIARRAWRGSTRTMLALPRAHHATPESTPRRRARLKPAPASAALRPRTLQSGAVYVSATRGIPQ
jgi:hypothetical protein